MTLLVDGNSIAWRNFHVARPLAHQGVPTNLAYGFLRSLRVALVDAGFTRCVVVWDGGRPEFRQKLLQGNYKVRRPGRVAPEEREQFHCQVRWLEDVLPLFGVEQCRCVGWEADDLLAALVLRFKGQQPVTIYSGDRDLWQLVDNRVSVLLPGGETVNLETFERLTGFQVPHQWFSYRVLTGDSSDNIPGVGGVGDVRARQFIGRGWPSAGFLGDAEKERLWWSARRATVDRNRAMMSLAYSATLLETSLRDVSASMKWVSPARDLSAARRAVVTAGMATLATGWLEWTQPFVTLASKPELPPRGSGA